jgi:tRNA1(Val) A37 N6-methylase TrmN6
MRPTPPPGADPGPDETLDQLIGAWWIYQLRSGHRFSTDDLMTAWRAAMARPDAQRCLDLGAGVGSVGLYVLGMLDRLGSGGASLVGVEAQEISDRLARRSIVLNGLDARVVRVLGDLRDPNVLPGTPTFDLVTGSPPYVPLGSGHVSPHPQRAACRMELRGSVVDYARAARRWIAPGGRFVYCMAARDPRGEAAASAAGLVILERFDVVFRAGDVPMISVFTTARADDEALPPRVDASLTIREADGAYGEAYRAFREAWGWTA